MQITLIVLSAEEYQQGLLLYKRHGEQNMQFQRQTRSESPFTYRISCLPSNSRFLIKVGSLFIV